ncbi:aldo/keto reductase [Pseudoroseicyclus tamaricis]|uniref:Gfo/Idh/MocA family oxidoreductase n=1 Tax=Pseudoroseicyclus tamaricis TaxID=2705421 RepID=A0A6B2JYA4_9RHOB|nr:aldo/keto reductase [Pseudoroseicyclus tamaricis]NDV00342.1 Gfo/Idh/MocA family oxidoreductase [Pseudoroseicyclus tamaricis]
MTIRWGIIGPGGIAGNFATGLAGADGAELVAIASRSAERRASFGERFGVAEAKRYDSYEALLADEDVDAVYIATPHPWHAEQGLMVIRAGKHLLCEKPAGLNAAEVQVLVEAAREEGVFFAEAFMWLCHPQIERLAQFVTTLGPVQHVRASFGFSAAFSEESRLYALELGGGGILDVGGYAVSAVRMVAGLAEGRFVDPVTFKGTGRLGQTGVDEVAYGLLGFESGITAEVSCAVARNMENVVRVECEKGTITLLDPWIPGRETGPSDAKLLIEEGGQRREEQVVAPKQLYAYEVEAASRAIEAGQTALAFPKMTPAGSIGNNAVLDRWRQELGYATIAERAGAKRHLSGTLPAGLPRIPTAEMPGAGPVSRLILGCDNRETLAEGAILFDAFREAGGTTFDTAHIYGQGLYERVLGQWIADRGVAGEVTVIVKGAHTPWCVPDAIGVQLGLSLGRLGLERAPIYIMHRDNPDVPVGEFVEAVARERDAGRIGIWGGSNWTAARFREAVDYAEAKGLEPPRILNNNLSLAVMDPPIWPGCLTSNDAETLAFLREKGVAHVAWSSQARGYFLPAAERGELEEEGTGPEAFYASPENEERLRRAEELAAKRGVSAHNVATAWVLAQSFPSFAVIGPRSPHELATTLPALGVELTAQEAAWLNLEG